MCVITGFPCFSSAPQLKRERRRRKEEEVLLAEIRNVSPSLFI